MDSLLGILRDSAWSGIGAIATAAAAVGLFWAARGLEFTVWNKMQDIFVDPAFTKARGTVFQHDATQQWTGSDLEAAMTVCRKMDEFCRLIRYLGTTKAIGVWGQPVGRSWVALEQVVLDERRKVGWQKWDAFERFGKRACGRLSLQTLQRLPPASQGGAA